MDRGDTLAAQRRLISSLRRTLASENNEAEAELIETHISWVLLTLDHAYKIKKAVNLGFLDFSALDKREYFCREELRLNQRLAPHYYLDVAAITGTCDQPILTTPGTAFEFALKMRRFPPYHLLSAYCESDERQSGPPELFSTLAKYIADFHSDAARAAKTSSFGDLEAVASPANDNIESLLSLINAASLRAQLTAIKDWQAAWIGQNQNRIAQRKLNGWVREGHGDLHFGNIAVTQHELIVFDCLEFDPALRWIDVCCDYAFLVMDCWYRGRHTDAVIFLNRYFELTGDYEGAALLKYYVTYRALVRAKVSAIRAKQSGQDADWRESFQFIALADRVIHASAPILILTCGVSGSGKSFLSQQLIASLPAPRIRSDVERKRLYLAAVEPNPHSTDHTNLYSRETTERTYARLHECAMHVLTGGLSVIVDATFLQQSYRQQFQELARAAGVSFVILHTTAAPAILERRISERLIRNDDPSDADLSVLSQQFANWEPFTPAEQVHAIEINTERVLDIAAVVSQIELHKISAAAPPHLPAA